MDTAHGASRHGIQSIEVGARLLEALAQARSSMMLRDLAAAAHMPPAKAHRYLVSFARMGLIEQHAETGRYDLGPFALQLGLSALARIEPLEVASPLVRALGDAIGQTVALAVWGNQGATIVRWFGVDAPVTASLRVGSVLPLTRSATGGAFLAFQHERTTARLLKRELTDNARLRLKPTSVQAVNAWVKQTRRNGIARTSDFIRGISGVAAPVFSATGAVTLAVVALGYSATFDLTLQGSVVRAVKDCARALSRRLGYRDEQIGERAAMR
jgi:DNA-binding IclR family transcriptional regulator